MPEVIIAPASGWGCARCGTDVAPALLACPSCRALRHAGELQRLAWAAEAAERLNDPATALARWREALDLLPPDAGQHATIARRVEELASRPLSAAAPKTEAAQATSRKGLFGVLAAVALFLVTKGKFVALFFLTKGKLLLFGLTKMSTLGTMFLSLGVYWSVWGWKLALGVVLSLYVHEMGHVAALARRGITGSMMMFVPGFGAFVGWRQKLHSEWEVAYVALWGPMWGLGGALVAYGLYLATGEPFWAVLAKIGGLLNLINLTPIWVLDGAQGFAAMSRAHRVAVVVSLLVAWGVSREGLILLPAAAAAFQVFQPPARQPDPRAVLIFVTLVGALATLARIPAPLL